MQPQPDARVRWVKRKGSVAIGLRMGLLWKVQNPLPGFEEEVDQARAHGIASEFHGTIRARSLTKSIIVGAVVLGQGQAGRRVQIPRIQAFNGALAMLWTHFSFDFQKRPPQERRIGYPVV